MFAINDLKSGRYIVLDGEPFAIIKHEFSKMGRGQGVMRTTLRNLKTGQTLERSFKGQEKVDPADISRSKANFLYAEGDQYFFMDQSSYDQFFITALQLGDKKDYLKENLEVDVLNFNSNPIGVEIPTKISYKVTQADPGVRGDTAQGAVMKKATLENGLEVNVPLFISQGDTIILNTESGDYVGKA
ncbi:MAG: elongation factor P [Candidatus Kerfeldbacteria bacterium]|nr:elongation factor P [Candidatus Kerfeldbacteria bacterium]